MCEAGKYSEIAKGQDNWVFEVEKDKDNNPDGYRPKRTQDRRIVATEGS